MTSTHPTDRAELDAAFRTLQDALAAGLAAGDMSAWVGCFTEDVVYVEHVHGTVRGRAALAEWAAAGAGQFPATLFTAFPVDWSVLDPEHGRVVWRAWNELTDPGDGSVHRFGSPSAAHYAGHGLWSHQEDAYSRTDVDAALMGWFARSHALHGPAAVPPGPRDVQPAITG